MNKKLFLVVWLCTLIWVVQNLQITQTIEKDIVAITKSTFKLVSEFEGKRNKAYQDTKGLWTIGVGHLIKSSEKHLLNATLTDDQIEELFKDDLRWCEAAVEDSVRVPLNQNQYDALYSLCFNIGETNFKRSEVVQHLNKNNYEKAANAFMNWVTPPVLKTRRQKERELFLRAI
jgi:lysozyme